ncbi:MAG: guanylate kinase [Coriobacteriales bacterium]|nr:guanylate kinase [Coriobacteriales bacterium]
MATGNLFVVSGPSGAGKGTLLNRVLKDVRGAWLSISATTRNPRAGEVDGVHYFFRTNSEFTELIAADGLLEWAVVHGNYYGTLREEVLRRLAVGIDVILEIDPQGAFQVRQNYPQAILIFIAPPSMEVLEQRLRLRGTETEEQIQTRLKTARLELAQADRYNVTIVNDELDSAAAELKAVLSQPYVSDN